VDEKEDQKRKTVNGAELYKNVREIHVPLL
jgi:hypothetical protein